MSVVGLAATRLTTARFRWGLRRRAQRESLDNLALAVTDLSLEMAGHRTRTDAELTLLRRRIETLERNAVEDIALHEDACRERVRRHTEEHHAVAMAERETT